MSFRSFRDLASRLGRLTEIMTKSAAGFKTGSVKRFRGAGRKARVLPRRFSMINVEEGGVAVLGAPVKSESDKKSYRTIRLRNGLTALLVSDPSTAAPPPSDDEEDDEDEDDDDDEDDEDEDGSDEEGGGESGRFEDKAAACALCIGVGSYSDPANVQGMAHFVEHMVFMGSAKYPVENDFDAFIKKKGGSDNAQTDCETTSFYFEVQEAHLNEAMDRFAQFFVSPLMKRDAMRRETEAIESEFAMALPSDGNRKERLLSCALPDGHPGRTFMWGNAKSLSPPIGPPQAELHSAAHAFRKRHYSAPRMTVAVQARLPLDTLEKYVAGAFGQVPDNGLPPDDFSKYAFGRSTATPAFHSFYHVKPTMQTTNLTLTWPMRSFIDDYKTKPHQYVAWIMGHEGTGSLLVHLQRRVWALGVQAGVSDSGTDHTSLLSLFTLSLVLTEEGLLHVDEVLNAIFGYVNMLKRDCPNERIFNEIRNIEEINFRFKDEPQPSDNVEELAENMQNLPPEHYITGRDLYFEYDPIGIKYVIEHLAPDSVNVMLQAQNYPEPIAYDQTEEWFGTEYKRTDFDPETIQKWKDMIPDKEFHLPGENPFIPDDFNLIMPPPDILALKQAKSEESKSELKLELVPPSLVKKNNIMEVWFKPDYRFDLPYSHVILKFIAPSDGYSAKTSCLLDLWNQALSQLLTEKLYAADVTGLTRSLYIEEGGILLKLHGFSQKLPTIIDEITQMLNNYNLSLTQELFVALKDVQIKAYANTAMKPTKLVKDARLSVLMHGYNTALDKLKEIKTITYEDLSGFGQKFLDKLYVKMLMQGNLTEEDALSIAKTVENNLQWNGMTEEDRPKFLVSKIPLGERHCRISSFNPADENSVIVNYYQYGISDIRNNCILELILLIMEEPLFDTLRTKEQLGYTVFGMFRYTDGVLGFTITANVQASKYCTSYVDTRIEEFLKEFLNTLKTMTQDSFEQSKTALIKMKNGVDVELKDEVRRNWSEISSTEYQFDRLLREIDCLNTLELSDIVGWFEDHVSCGSRKNFRKLSVQIVGHKQAKEPTGHVDKKAKLSDQMNIMLKDCNYSVKYLEGQSSAVEYITDIKSFKKSLENYPEKVPSIKFVKES